MIISPLLSIVIPTLNRYDTLIPVIESLLTWKYNNFEIIIQDNSTDNSIIINSLILKNKDYRIKYFYTKDRISAIQNCNLAIDNASGEYVCFIGDDDILLPEILNVCSWLSKNHYESMCTLVPLYTWNDMIHSVSVNNGFNGKIILPNFNGHIEDINPIKELNKLIKIGAQNLFKMPRTYQGIVSLNVLHKLKNKTNTYFPGPVPDMSNAVAISLLIEKHCYIDLPLIIAGHSKKSMSGKNSQRLHQGEITSEKSLNIFDSDNWSKKIPFFWSAPTIWAEAAIKSLDKMEQSKYLEKFNYDNVYASCFVYCKKEYFNRIHNSIIYENNILGIIYTYTKVSIKIIQITILRITNYLKKLIFGINGISSESIGDAVLQCQLRLSKINYSKTNKFEQ
jgi:glycosyltransferase involved in cell wall biosynthesis